MAYRRREEALSDVLTNQEVVEIWRLYQLGDTKVSLAKQFGVHRNTIHNVIERYKRQNRKRK